MLAKWDMFCQIALECPAFQVCKLGSSGQGSDGLGFGPLWQQLMKMVHRNIQMLVYRFWGAYRNTCEIKLYDIKCASVFQSHSEKQGILLKTKLLGQSKLLDATWYHPRGPFVKRSPLISRVFQLGEIFIRFAPSPHRRSSFQSHKSMKKSGQNWGERLRTYFCGLLYYDLPWFAKSWFPLIASDTSVRKFPPVTRPHRAPAPLYPAQA